MNHESKRIAIFGAGGHGKVVADAIEHNIGLSVACVVDDRPRQGARVLGHTIAGGRDALLAHRNEIDGVIVAIGDNRTRRDIASWLVAHGFALQSVVHPSAMVAPSAEIGAGVLIMPGAVVNADARIGVNTIINSGAIVEHDCDVGEGVHVAPGAVLCGGVCVGSGTLIGAGAVLLPGVKVAPSWLVKAGEVVAKNLESND